MVKITVNSETVNNTIPTTILLDKAITNNSLDEEEVVRVETGLGEDEKVRLKEEEILSVEDELDEEDGTVEVEESAVERLDVNLQKNQRMVFCMIKSSTNKRAEKQLIL